MSASTWNLLIYFVGVATLGASYLSFSPVTRDLVNFLSRGVQIKIFKSRHLLWSIGIGAFAVLLYRLLFVEGSGLWFFLLITTVLLFSLAFWATYVPVVMAPPKEQRVISSAEADAFLKPDDQVLGLHMGDHVRAYPRSLIARPHWFNDEINGKPIMVSYCILCNSGQAFVPMVNGKRLDLRNLTAYNNNTVYHDTLTGNYIQQIEKRVIEGPDKGAILESYPVVMTSWKSWKEIHPNTDLLYAPPLTARDKATQMMLDKMIPLERLAARSKPWHLVRGVIDNRLPAMSFVFGVEAHGDAVAFTLDGAKTAPVINENVGGELVVLMYDMKRDVGQIFSRKVADKVLTFVEPSAEYTDAADIVALDTETGSAWDVSGRCQSGTLKGNCLDAFPHYNKLFWFSWAAFNPKTRIVGADSGSTGPASTASVGV